MKSVVSVRDSAWLLPVYFPICGSASVLVGGKRQEEGGIFGCVIASLLHTSVGTEERSAPLWPGSRATYVLRMLA